MVFQKTATVCLVALLTVMITPIAKADLVANYDTGTGYSIAADLAANSSTINSNAFSQGYDYLLQLTVTNNTGIYGYVQGYSIQLFNSNVSKAVQSSLTLDGLQPLSTNSSVLVNNPASNLFVNVNNQTSNSSNGTNNCNATGNGFGSVCEIFQNFATVGLGQGQSLTFNVEINSGGASVMSTSGWHVISDATLNSDGTGGNSPYAISATPAGVPEPGSLALLSTGMFGLAGLVRRRFRRK